MKNTNQLPIHLLLSGGVDSTACIKYYLQKHYKVQPLYVDYGQPNAKSELKAAKSISDFYNLALEKVVIGTKSIPEGYVRGRNAVLLLVAFMHCSFDKGIVAIGIHSGTDYQDCSKEFVQLMQQTYSLYEDGSISIDAPFINWSKSEIIDFAEQNDVPINLCFSSSPSELPEKFQKGYVTT